MLVPGNKPEKFRILSALRALYQEIHQKIQTESTEDSQHRAP